MVAQELAVSRSMLVFVALRPSTFYASKLSGALSGYKNEVLSISPPPAHDVIRKRLVFALRVAAGRTAPAALEGVSLSLGSIELFLTAMLNSIRRNKDIKRFLGNITGGNTRLVLELITSFCGSPNVEAERIVAIQAEKGNYSVPLHEFTKHALLGEYSHYNAISSLVACNVFDITLADRREHFISLLMIGFLASPTGMQKGDGFLPGSVVMSEMMRLGFVESQVRAALRRLAQHRLIETPHAHFREIAVPDSQLVEEYPFRATSVGIYHTRYWAGSFAFLDAMSLDTPILGQEKRDTITQYASSFAIEDRLEKATAFLHYLKAAWFDANFDENYFDFDAAMDSQGDSFRSVNKVVNRLIRERAELSS